MYFDKMRCRYGNRVLIRFVIVCFISYVSIGINEKINCVEKSKLCFSIKESGTMIFYVL